MGVISNLHGSLSLNANHVSIDKVLPIPNNNVNTNNFSTTEITNAPADFSITGFIIGNDAHGKDIAGSDGQLLDVYNLTGHSITLSHLSCASSKINQIRNFSGADLVLPAGFSYAKLI